MTEARLNRAIQRLRGYCKPYDQGGAGGSNHTGHIELVLDEVERLKTIAAGHPTTKDGQVITWGDRLWAVRPDTSDEFEPDNSWAGWITVRNMEQPYPDDPPRWLIIPVDSIDGCFFNDECYSTKAAAEAAKEKP